MRNKGNTKVAALFQSKGLYNLVKCFLWWLMLAGPCSYLYILMQFLQSTPRRFCSLPVGTGLWGAEGGSITCQDQYSGIVLFFPGYLPPLSLPAYHTVKNNRHRRQKNNGKKIAWCSNLVLPLLWDGLHVLEIDFRNREEIIPWLFHSFLVLCLLFFHYLMLWTTTLDNLCCLATSYPQKNRHMLLLQQIGNWQIPRSYFHLGFLTRTAAIW